MEKHRVTDFVLYFIILLLLVITSMKINLNIVNMVYLVVVLGCSLKFILIVNNDKR